MRRYLLAFLIGWAFGLVVDAHALAHASTEAYRWLQQGWLAPLQDAARKPTR